MKLEYNQIGAQILLFYLSPPHAMAPSSAHVWTTIPSPEVAAAI